MVRGFFWYNKDEETRLDSWLMMSLRLAFASPFFAVIMEIIKKVRFNGLKKLKKFIKSVDVYLNIRYNILVR